MTLAQIILTNIREMILNNSLSALISTYYKKPNESMEEYQRHLVWQQTTRLKLLNQIDDALKVVPEESIVKKVYIVIAKISYEGEKNLAAFHKEETANKFSAECVKVRDAKINRWDGNEVELELCRQLDCPLLEQYLLANPKDWIGSNDKFYVEEQDVMYL